MRHIVLSILLLVPLAFCARVAAQQALYVKQNDRFSPVVAMAEDAPQVIIDGKQVVAEKIGGGWVFALGQAKTYTPYFVTVRTLDIAPQVHEVDPYGVPVDRALAITGGFESAYSLKKVYLALEVKGDAPPVNILIAHEVGDIKPGSPASVRFVVPFGGSWENCHATLHLFVGGPEVLHSNMALEKVEHALDVMVQKQIEGIYNAPPKLFFGPPPEYPDALIGRNVEGRVTIALDISTTGAVLDPIVKEASLPEFGEAALKAVRQWRFLPRIKDGIPVAAKVVLPLSFKPPSVGIRQ
jgi:TonB family protein